MVTKNIHLLATKNIHLQIDSQNIIWYSYGMIYSRYKGGRDYEDHKFQPFTGYKGCC